MTDPTRARRVHSDTSTCPRGHRCEACGTELLALTVEAVPSPLGIMCLTLCEVCAASTVDPPVSVATAERLVAQHAMHLAAPRRVDPPSGVLRRTVEVPWP